MTDADCTPGREPRSVAASFIFVTLLFLSLKIASCSCRHALYDISRISCSFSQAVTQGLFWVFEHPEISGRNLATITNGSKLSTACKIYFGGFDGYFQAVTSTGLKAYLNQFRPALRSGSNCWRLQCSLDPELFHGETHPLPKINTIATVLPC